jgi:hypothetical protein
MPPTTRRVAARREARGARCRVLTKGMVQTSYRRYASPPVAASRSYRSLGFSPCFVSASTLTGDKRAPNDDKHTQDWAARSRRKLDRGSRRAARIGGDRGATRLECPSEGSHWGQGRRVCSQRSPVRLSDAILRLGRGQVMNESQCHRPPLANRWGAWNAGFRPTRRLVPLSPPRNPDGDRGATRMLVAGWGVSLLERGGCVHAHAPRHRPHLDRRWCRRWRIGRSRIASGYRAGRSARRSGVVIRLLADGDEAAIARWFASRSRGTTQIRCTRGWWCCSDGVAEVVSRRWREERQCARAVRRPAG